MAGKKKINTEDENQAIVNAYRNLLRSARRSLSTGEKKQIRAAFNLAMESHKDMRRKSGEPYIMHPLAVAHIVAKEMELDANSIVAALLHDTVEDTDVTLEDIRDEFGHKVERIVDGLTKISGVFDVSNQSEQAENFRKLLLSLADDVRVILIKIADRLHNMRTLDSMPRKKQLKIAGETDFLYAPLAHRLGLYNIKSELEDLSMKYTESDIYKDIAKKLDQKKKERQRFISEFNRPIKARLSNEGFKCKVLGRPKSISSIWNKMQNKQVEFHEVYDLFAIRIVLDSSPEREKADCWAVYSIITDFYKPKPDRLRDWISTPKANGYESLHTTVMGPHGKWVEVQIRTDRMHEIAEKGFAAHWKYKEGSNDSALDNWLQKMRDMMQNPESDALDFLDDFKLNLFTKEIYVFTPKGDLRILPLGATALDFAFDIHTHVGSSCIGAKVNHKLVPLSYPLETGDQIEVLTSTKQKPNDDWLNFAVTGKARSKIKSALKEETKKVATDGKEILARKFKSNKFPLNPYNIEEASNHFGYKTSHDFFVAVAQKQVDLSQLKKFSLNGDKLEKPAKPKKEKKKRTSKKQKVINPGISDMLVFDENTKNIAYVMAQCCNPIPGDDVFGFITINEGIKVHRTNCPNATKMMSTYGYRIVKTRWTQARELSFLTGIRITGLDDVGVIQKLTRIISDELKINIRSISVDGKDGIFEGNIVVFVNDTAQLEKLSNRLKRLKGILTVNRYDAEGSEPKNNVA